MADTCILDRPAWVDEMMAGLIDAELGGDVVKKRVRCQGEVNVPEHRHWWQRAKKVTPVVDSTLVGDR